MHLSRVGGGARGQGDGPLIGECKILRGVGELGEGVTDNSRFEHLLGRWIAPWRC